MVKGHPSSCGTVIPRSSKRSFTFPRHFIHMSLNNNISPAIGPAIPPWYRRLLKLH